MLASYAMQSSLGRRHPEPQHAYRNDFQRDRDRVIHSRAFRRLEAKTQVFTRRYSDHFRNRLTHTIEVAQISRTIAAALGLNVDLVEALALAHDVGHPPFGHAGEKALDSAMREHGFSFDHNLHALRIVEHFEQHYAAFRGLNLTFEVREGIVKHSRDYDAKQFPELAEYLLDQRPPLEAQLIDLTDELAYNTADLDDGYEARLLQFDQIKAGVPVFAEIFPEVAKLYPDAPKKLQFNEVLRRILDRWVGDLIRNTQAEISKLCGAEPALSDRSQRESRMGAPAREAITTRAESPASREAAQSPTSAAERRQTPANGASRGSGVGTDIAPEGRLNPPAGKPVQSPLTLADIRSHPHRLASLSPEIETERRLTKEFLYQNLYYAPELQPEKNDAERIISELFALWMNHPEKLPRSYQEQAASEPLARVVCDYIAGMTDPYITDQFGRLVGRI
jgi:dGTPase